MWSSILARQEKGNALCFKNGQIALSSKANISGMDSADRGFESRLAFYKAVEIRQRVSPLFLARNLRYYVRNKSPRFHHHYSNNKQCNTRMRPSLQMQQRELERSERDVTQKRSLTIRINNCQPNFNISISVFVEHNYRTILVEKYEVEVSASCGGVDVDIPLEYAFAMRRHSEYLLVMFERTPQTTTYNSQLSHVVKQVFRTDGPLVISCEHCRQVRLQSRSSNAYLHSVDQAMFEQRQCNVNVFKFYVWKQDVVQSGKVEGNGFRFTLLWSNKRVATTDCRENIQAVPVSRLPPQPKRSSDARYQATRLEQVLPLELTWAGSNRKQTLRDFRCPICDMFLGSSFGVLTHMRTNHDRFTVQQQQDSTHEFNIHPCTITTMPTPTLLLQPKRPLGFAHTSDAFALYSDLSDDADSEVDVSWKDEYGERRMAEFIDVHVVEKGLMLMWNRYVHEQQQGVNNRNVFALMQRFIHINQQQLQSRAMIPNLLLLLVTLHDFGQLTPEQITELTNGF